MEANKLKLEQGDAEMSQEEFLLFTQLHAALYFKYILEHVRSIFFNLSKDTSTSNTYSGWHFCHLCIFNPKSLLTSKLIKPKLVIY